MLGNIKRAALLGAVLCNPCSGWAQERELPLLNSIGRYLGIGYTRGGYHAPRDGRPDLISQRHPPSHYRPGGWGDAGFATSGGLHQYSPSSQWVPEFVQDSQPAPGAAYAPVPTSTPEAEWRLPPATQPGLLAPTESLPSGPLQQETLKPPANSPKETIRLRALDPAPSPSDDLSENHSARLPNRGSSELGVPAR